jgi:hypothetical protein
MTSYKSSILAGEISKRLKYLMLMSKFQRLIEISSAESMDSPSVLWEIE